jgi:glycine/D-amino acid oxidase-like deaminating enzyme
MSAGVVVFDLHMSLFQKKRVAVIGAGTVGLSAAFRLLELYKDQVEVTIIAAEFLQQTTSYGSGGLWEPYQIAGIYVC